MHDFKITNVRIVDGTGAYFHGEVAVKEGAIVESRKTSGWRRWPGD